MHTQPTIGLACLRSGRWFERAPARRRQSGPSAPRSELIELLTAAASPYDMRGGTKRGASHELRMGKTCGGRAITSDANRHRRLFSDPAQFAVRFVAHCPCIPDVFESINILYCFDRCLLVQGARCGLRSTSETKVLACL